MDIREHLEAVTAWAEARLRSGQEPPWTHSQLTQLHEAASGLRDGLLVATQRTESSRESDSQRANDPPPGASIHLLGTARSRLPRERIQLPT